ncbi:MAG: N-acetylglucosamine-6-phosphate deacetylase, partial [Rhizobiaceae bacterium]|nr:N-acetylglucosamine-6-phosphate deacetylase [Rhizobiaceae bacterium]
SLYPAQAVGQQTRLGRLGAGAAADFVHLSDALEVKGVWVGARAA